MNSFNLMFAMLKPLAELLFKAIFLILIIVLPILFSILIHYLYLYKKGYRKKKRTVQEFSNRESILKRIFIDFPRRFCLDLYNKDPDEFNYYGFWLFCGEQGSGKSVASADFIRRIKTEFPLSKVMANIGFKWSNKFIDSHEDIIYNNFGTSGTVVFIDEIQNWFNSSERVNFPPEIIQEICQQRKQHKIVVGTSQCFNRISLPLRQQVNYLCLPMTIAGCLTIVRVYKPTVSEDGQIKKKRHVKTYFFVHDEELRNSYDTWEKVKRLSLKDYKSK